MGVAPEFTVEQVASACIFRVDRPAKRNALTFEVGAGLLQVMHDAENDRSIRGIVLAGTPQAFSTGIDLIEAREAAVSPERYRRFKRHWRSVLAAIEQSSKPVIAAIEGYCLTGGLEFALACDLRYASTDATFGMTSTKIGSVPGMGGTQRLPRLIGPAQAMEMIFTSRFMDAEEAARIGLVNRVVAEGEVVDEALATIEAVTRMGPLAVGYAKRAIRTGVKLDLESGLDLEESFSWMALQSKDKEEGSRAFLEKRDPVFRGE